MIRSWLLFIMLACPVASGDEQTIEAFQEGNRLYLAGAYEKAIEAYVEKGRLWEENPGLYCFNLGNCAFRLDMHGQALAYYLAARNYWPRDSRVLHNIEVARTRLGLTDDRPFLERAGEALILFTAPECLALSALFGSAALLLWACWMKWRRDSLNRSALGLFAAAVVLCVLGLIMSLDLSDSIGVATKATLVYSDPSSGAGEVLFTLREGEEVRLEEVRDQWRSVRDPQGRTGWVHFHNLFVLP